MAFPKNKKNVVILLPSSLRAHFPLTPIVKGKERWGAKGRFCPETASGSVTAHCCCQPQSLIFVEQNSCDDKFEHVGSILFTAQGQGLCVRLYAWVFLCNNVVLTANEVFLNVLTS